MGFRGAAEGFQGASTWGSNMGPKSTATLIKHLSAFIISCCPLRSLVSRWDLEGQQEMIKALRCFISVAVPPGPMLLPHPMLLSLETPCCCALKPQVCRASKPLGTNFESKIFKFRGFLGPSDQNELYHTPLLSKI